MAWAVEGQNTISSCSPLAKEGVEVHGYLPVLSEIPVSEIGGADQQFIALSACQDSTHESDDDAARGLFAVLLQGKNKCSSSAKPYVSPISFANDNDSQERLSPVRVCVRWTFGIGNE